uniref:malonyl-coenzyme A:anthocyanin 3-O-glucoside-6''-O-malonyltransferase-like n=1 Tax=Erigeron canadensis TaxID=72917 RepID=UPI001CB968D6|nr:malonyl-coenzyme A:anthocyanin 3-O-glucoside-6''-O-malonyltransferase-like [Erigeron canadensis]
MAAINHLTYLERCQVSAPPKTVGEKTLPLTFLDLLHLPEYPVTRLYFYDFPHSTSHIIQTLVPKLKHSLSITLQHFFPFAGKLVMFPDDVTRKPEIRHEEGDWVALTVAESSLDFVDLVGNLPRDRNKFHLLIPDFEFPIKENYFPTFAVQVTVFPNSGISIGLALAHILSDASSLNAFFKAWNSMTKNGTDEAFLATGSVPFYDRSVIKYPNLENIYVMTYKNHHQSPSRIQVFEKMYQTRSLFAIQNDSRVVAKFHLTQTQINLLKKFVLVRFPTLEYVSSFSVGCAYVWMCMAKSRTNKKHTNNIDEIVESFVFYANLRARLDPPVPETYFGNCVGLCIATAKTSTLVTTSGFLKAAEVIVKCIRENTTVDVIKEAETWMEKLLSVRAPAICVAGSSKFNVYDVDFGWGKPRMHRGIKINNPPDDVIHIDATRESPHDLEFGLSLCPQQMSAFIPIFENEIRNMCALLENKALPTAKL